MVIEAVLFAVLQTAGAAPELPACSLVTPRGDTIGFFLRSTEDPDEIRLSPTGGSAWPVRTIVGTRRDMRSELRFAIGGRDGFVLELASNSERRPKRSATLFLRAGQRSTLPVAYGFCEERPPAASGGDEPGADPAAVGTDNLAFDPAHWPEGDCGLILSDGRRIRFDFTLIDRDQVRLESSELWPGRPVTTGIRWMNSSGVQVGSFGRRGGPEGVQMMFVDRSRAVKLIRLQQVGGPSAANLTGYGICGYNNIVRRPGP